MSDSRTPINSLIDEALRQSKKLLGQPHHDGSCGFALGRTLAEIIALRNCSDACWILFGAVRHLLGDGKDHGSAEATARRQMAEGFFRQIEELLKQGGTGGYSFTKGSRRNEKHMLLKKIIACREGAKNGGLPFEPWAPSGKGLVKGAGASTGCV